MKKLNKASKLFILALAVITLITVFAVSAFAEGGTENLIKTYASDSAEDFYAYRWNIDSVTFVNTLDGAEGKDVYKVWDIGADGSEVKAWVKISTANVLSDEDKTEIPLDKLRFALYIGANGNVRAGKSLDYFFYNFSNLYEVNGLEYFDTSAVESFRDMFSSCNSIKELDLSALNTESAVDMSSMFYNCIALEDLNVVGFDTEDVLAMTNMFSGCTRLRTINLKTFNMRKVTDTQRMFYNCQELKKIYVDNDWLLLSVISSEDMFTNCFFLEGKISYNPAMVDVTYAKTTYYTTHVSAIEENQPVNIRIIKEMKRGERCHVSQLIGNYYLREVKEFTSSNTDVVVIYDDGEILATGAGKATINTVLDIEGSIVLEVIVTDINADLDVEEEPTFLDKLLASIKKMLSNFVDFMFGWMK